MLNFTNGYLCLIEEHRLPETTEYIKKLQQLQIADFLKFIFVFEHNRLRRNE